jgi:hypothetical protein
VVWYGLVYIMIGPKASFMTSLKVEQFCWAFLRQIRHPLIFSVELQFRISCWQQRWSHEDGA